MYNSEAGSTGYPLNLRLAFEVWGSVLWDWSLACGVCANSTSFRIKLNVGHSAGVSENGLVWGEKQNRQKTPHTFSVSSVVSVVAECEHRETRNFLRQDNSYKYDCHRAGWNRTGLQMICNTWREAEEKDKRDHIWC